MDTLARYVDLFAPVAAVAAGVFAVWTYARANRIRRAEWLLSLHEKFYEAATYKTIRRMLDYGSDEELARVERSLQGGLDDDLSEAFVDYLNFFEFVANLRRLRQITKKELLMLFDYYLRNLNQHDFVRTFVAGQGFEALHQELRRLRPALPPAAR